MSHTFGELSAQRRNLGVALRRLRVATGLSGEQIAQGTGISPSRVSWIELGQQPRPGRGRGNLGQGCRAEGDDLAAVIELAEAAATQTST